MFALKKILTSLILPPGIFVVLALLSGLWMLRRRDKYGIMNLILAALIYFFSISPAADILMGPLEKNWTIPRQVNGDLIVVLGGGIHSGVPDASGRGFPAEAGLSRLVTAVRLHRATGAPIIYSGGEVFGKEAEALVARRILRGLGVPEERIIVEGRSRDTMENARFVKEIWQQGNWRQPLLVTSASHLARSLTAFRKVGLEVTPYPADFLVAPHRTWSWPDFLPSAGSLTRSVRALHEYLGMIFYKFAY